MKQRKYLIIALLLTGFTTAFASSQETEKFRLVHGGQPIEGRPVSWDFTTGVLTLETVDGSTREIPANELHTFDGKIIERILRKQLVAGRKKAADKSTGVLSTESPHIELLNGSGDADLVNGVKWYSDESFVRQLARGNEGIEDDRPVIWFRVLGDLTGFM